MENLHYPPKLRRCFGPGRSGEPVCRYALCETENWLGLVNGLQQVCAWRLLPALKECAVRGRLASFHRTPSFPQQEGGAGDVTVRGVSSSPVTERHTLTGWFTHTCVLLTRVQENRETTVPWESRGRAGGCLLACACASGASSVFILPGRRGLGSRKAFLVIKAG